LRHLRRREERTIGKKRQSSKVKKGAIKGTRGEITLWDEEICIEIHSLVRK